MIKEKIEITTANISVKVLQVDGQKMTKATFRQIETLPRVGLESDRHYLGWVNGDTRGIIYLVSTRNNKIYKTQIGDGTPDQANMWLIETTKNNYEQLFIAT